MSDFDKPLPDWIGEAWRRGLNRSIAEKLRLAEQALDVGDDETVERLAEEISALATARLGLERGKSS